MLSPALRRRAIRLRGGSGLGDSVYLRPVVDHLVGNGDVVTVLSNYPDLFRDTGATVQPFAKNPVNVLGHYSFFRSRQTTNQFQDVLESARISADVPLQFEWRIANHALVADLRRMAARRRLILVHGGREPFGRTDGLGMEIMPTREAFAAALSAIGDSFTVRIGKGLHLYDLPADLDLVEKTSISDLIDLHAACDGVVTQCGFPVPLAECFGRPALVVFGAAGLASRHPIIRLITPAKILCKPSSSFLVDDWTDERIMEAARAFRDFPGSSEQIYRQDSCDSRFCAVVPG